MIWLLNHGRAITECCSPNRTKIDKGCGQGMLKPSAMIHCRQRPYIEQAVLRRQKDDETHPERPHHDERGGGWEVPQSLLAATGTPHNVDHEKHGVL